VDEGKAVRQQIVGVQIMQFPRLLLSPQFQYFHVTMATKIRRLCYPSATFIVIACAWLLAEPTLSALRYRQYGIEGFDMATRVLFGALFFGFTIWALLVVSGMQTS